VVVLAGVTTSLVAWWRAADRPGLATPLDLNFLGLFVLAVLQLVPSAGRAEGVVWLHVGLSCLAAFYVVLWSARLRGRLPSLGPAIAVAVLVPGLHALWASTGGLDGLAASSVVVDAAWGARQGALKLLLLVLPLAIGRAAEANASPYWRVIVLVGALAAGLHAAAHGSGLARDSFDRLSDPLFFSNLAASMLVIVAVFQAAMGVAREDARHAVRWRSVSASFIVLGTLAVLGEVSGGAGVRAVAALAAGVVLAAAEEPRRLEADEPAGTGLPAAA
jgi:hypothetical protein